MAGQRNLQGQAAVLQTGSPAIAAKDSNLSIGKSTGKKKKTGKTHDCCKIHPVQSLDDCIGRGKIFGF